MGRYSERTEKGLKMHGGMTELSITKRALNIVRRGRKRGNGARGSTGRLKQTYENPKAQVLKQPHRMEAKAELRDRQEAESEFGRLMCNGLITPAQHEAGLRYRLAAMAYRSIVLGAQAATPQSAALLGGGKGTGAEPSRETINRIRESYNNAFEFLGNAGNRAQRAVKEHAVFERKVETNYERAALKCGLDKLIVHFGIDPRLQISHALRNRT